ncbi:unnamed protein product [Fusarium equiseti]|uniref:DNA2/NAM7 helicase-like C-terminal domain-containing protein n=1 Tax=Fusarium equiseti TaxID=61235 RepID=A0A8J2NEK7_FUSEQ|nr:unnamed protein product [Fusarium equiseti]
MNVEMKQATQSAISTDIGLNFGVAGRGKSYLLLKAFYDRLQDTLESIGIDAASHFPVMRLYSTEGESAHLQSSEEHNDYESLTVTARMKMDISMKPIKAESLALNVCNISMKIHTYIDKAYRGRGRILTSDFKSGYDNSISHITKPENEPSVTGKYINRKLYAISTKATPNDVFMITPYRGNLECLESVRNVKTKDMPDIANITINTTGSFQGRVEYVVIPVLAHFSPKAWVIIGHCPRLQGFRTRKVITLAGGAR